MKPKTKRAFTVAGWVVLALSLLLGGVQPARAQKLSFTFITIDVPGAIFTVAQGVASDGTVAGFYLDDQTFVLHGFLWSSTSGFKNPIDVPKATGTIILAIDPPGEFVDGVYFDTAGNQHGFVMRLSDLSFAPVDITAAMFTVPFDINTGGEIVGLYVDGNGIQHGFSVPVIKATVSLGIFQSIDFPGAAFTHAFGINDKGDIVGQYIAPHSPRCNSFRLSTGNFTTLPVPGGGGGLAFGINDTGEVAGIFGSACPFLLTNPAAFTGLGLRSPTISLGLVGVQGYVLAPDGTFTVVIFPGAQSTQPQKINYSGKIVGFYNTAPGPGSMTHGFLATPNQ
jgi:uncharacterized membrane protein